MKPERGMIGRDAERRDLGELIRGAAEGRGGAALLGGDAGIGKSRLARHVAEEAGLPLHHARVLEGQASAYRLLIELLRTTPPGAPPGVIKALGNGEQLSEQEAEDVPRALIEALAALADSGPAILILDDLHWADAATLELLPQLVARIEQLPLALLLSYRSDGLDRSHPVRRLRSQLRRLPRVLDLALKPLSLQDTGTLAEFVLGSPIGSRLRRELFQQTEGLPFFVEELCRTLVDSPLLARRDGQLDLDESEDIPIPESIRDIVLRPVDDLDEEAREGLEAAAVAGAEFDLELLLELGVVEEAVDELLRIGLLIEIDRTTGGFRHALTREAVLDQIPWSRRRRLNGALAPLAARRGAPKRVIATHYRAAGRNEEARKAFLEDARQSCHLHAYLDAQRSFQQALELWPEDEEVLERLDALERLGECAQVSGHLSESARVWREVLESEVLRHDPGRLGRAWRNLASIHALQSSPQRALAARQSACEAFRKAGADGEAATELLAIAEAEILRLQLAHGIQLAEEALAHARAAGDHGLEANAISLTGLGLGMQGKAVEARRRIEAALELALRHNTRDAASVAYQRMPYVYGYRADYHGQRDSFGSAIEFCDREALEDERSACLGCMAYAMMRVGNWKRAIEVSRDVLKTMQGTGMLGKLVLGILAVFRGELKSARSQLTEADTEARRHGLAPVELITRGGLAMIAEQAHEHEEAARRYRDLLAFWETTEDRLDILISLTRAATFFAGRAEIEDLNACTEIARRIAAENAHPEALGTLSFLLGESALLDGQSVAAQGHFLRAREEFERSDLKLEMALCDWRHGIAHQAAGDREQALDLLRRGYREARSLGARPLLTTLSALLESEGGCPTEERLPEAPTRSVRAGLTQRQREVAELIAQGMTNKEIAGELGLSTRTIDMHVGNVLDRLNCRSRTEAVKRLVDLGVLE